MAAHHAQGARESTAESRIAVVFSRGIRAIRHIETLAEVDALLSPSELRAQQLTASCVLVWGRKANAAAALQYAAEHKLPVQYLEDGWIRSSARNPHSRTCYSILKDSSGVYYDSRSPSDLENLLNLDDAQFDLIATPENIAYAQQCRERMVASNITKYNFNSHATTNLAKATQARVLVVDQTFDDASVVYGGMDAQAFERMLQAAIAENPGAHIMVRMHPDVVSGRKRGYLKALASTLDVEISTAAINPLIMLKEVDKVYVGTSQLGFEALLCNKPVVVFGQPFYAGWGLSDDRAPIARRVQKRCLNQLFYACYIALARYCSPVTGRSWQLHECLDHVELQLRMFEKNARHFDCLGITPWKQKYVRQYLRSPDGSVNFQSDRTMRRSSNKVAPSAKLTWGYKAFKAIQPDADQADNGVPLLRLEDGFLRSTGLGSDFNAPASLVVDERGLYFDPARESDLEAMLNRCDCTPAEILRAVTLKKLILSSRLSKYNIGTESDLSLSAPDKHSVLVVGQVEDDASIKRGCVKICTNADLLIAVRAARPDAWIRYKPHPDVVAGNRKGAIDASVLSEYANTVETEASIVDCVEACDELHTMTSLSGFEALMRGKPVVTYGAPFYAGWGLTEDHQPIARRTRRRTLDELVYLSLIAYPRYVDIETGEFTTPEELVLTIVSQRAMKKNLRSGWSARQISKVVNIVRGLRYAP